MTTAAGTQVRRPSAVRTLTGLLAATAVVCVAVEVLNWWYAPEQGAGLSVRTGWALLRSLGFLLLIGHVRRGRAGAKPFGLILAVTTVFAVGRLIVPRQGMPPLPGVLGFGVLTALCVAVVWLLYRSTAVGDYLVRRSARSSTGGSPCAAAALAARRAGASVLLLDRAAFPRDKPCGDGIAAHVLDPAGAGPPEQRIVTSGPRWPAYAWSFPVGWSGGGPAPPGLRGPDGGANVGYGEVLRGEPLSRARLVDGMAAPLPDLDPDTVTDLRAHHLPLSTHRPAPGRGRIVLAGDALSLINPFTGEGIFYAVLSGALAGAAAARSPDTAAERYAYALRRRLGRHLRHSSAAAWPARRPAMVDAAVRAAARDTRVFGTWPNWAWATGCSTPVRWPGSAPDSPVAGRRPATQLRSLRCRGWTCET